MAFSPTPLLRYSLATLGAGVIAGLVGLACKALLHIIEYLVWDVESQTLLLAVSAHPGWYRGLVIVAAGVFGAVSWTLFFRRGGVVSIPTAIDGQRIPILRSVWHAATQIIIVGLGASIGREAAPREVSAALAAWLGDALKLSPEERRIVVACGASAGLASVYAIPISGALFALEVLLMNARIRSVITATFVSAIAVVVSQGWHRPQPFYTVPDLVPSWSILVWAAVCGPIIGLLAWLFRRIVARCQRNRPRDFRLLWTLPLAFSIVGLIAVWVPSVMGNGQSTAQVSFDGENLLSLTWVTQAPIPPLIAALGFLLAITAAKAVTTLITIRSGGWGGTLTPALAMGAGLGAASGLAWNALWPGSNIAFFAFVGAATFLGVSLRAPLTGFVLVIEFTQHYGVEIIAPTAIALLGAVMVSYWCQRRYPPGRQ